MTAEPTLLAGCLSRARRRTAASLMCLLAGCGGGGDDPPAAPQAQARADSMNVAWNLASDLNVTANDTSANGTASVAITTAPAHGTATTAGSTIRYTPEAGYFGPDSLRYRLSVGTATSDADVALSVAAKVTLAGTVSDAPLPNATVVATVGATALPAVVADAAGAYRIEWTTSEPTAFVALAAQGAGAQSKVVLQSLVGEAAAVVAAAASGVVGAGALPALNVTHLSTAVAAMTRQALGRAPASSADVRSVQAQLSSDEIIERAVVIKRIADQGVALPASAADTLALLSDATAYRTFVAQQVAADAAGFAQTRQQVIDDPALALAPPAVTADAPTRLLLVPGQFWGAQVATRLILNADGTARVESDRVTPGSWRLDGKDIAVTYDAPIVTQSFSADLDPVTLQQNELELRQLGLRVRRLSGASHAMLTPVAESLYVDGSRAGTVISDPDYWAGQAIVGAPQALTAGDLAVDSRWAGVVSTGQAPGTALFEQDVMRIVDATHMRFERSGQTGTWRLVDGALEVSVDDAVFSYSRLFTGPRGEERWLAEQRVGNAVVALYDAAVFKAQSGAAFTAAGLVGHWKSYVSEAASSSGVYLELAADGSAVDRFTNPGEPDSVSSNRTWTLGSDGRMTENAYFCDSGGTDCAPTKRRSWQLLGTAPGRLYVMEERVFGGFSSYYVNIFTAAP